MTTSCDVWRERLADAASGDPVLAPLEAHLAACAACRQTLAVGQALHARIDGVLRQTLAESPSPNLVPRVREQLSQPRGTSWIPLLVSAAAGLALLWLSIGGGQRPTDSSLPVRAAAARPAPATAAAPAAPTAAPPAVRRVQPRADRRREAAGLGDGLLSPIPDAEPVRTSTLVIAPLDASPPIELKPLVTVGLDSEGAER